jgi:hypothetical protein
MSIIQDPEVYERFEKILLIHGVRYVNEKVAPSIGAPGDYVIERAFVEK